MSNGVFLFSKTMRRSLVKELLSYFECYKCRRSWLYTHLYTHLYSLACNDHHSFYLASAPYLDFASSFPPFSLSAVNLMPTTPIVEERLFQGAGGVGVALGKSRKRVFPVPHTQEPDTMAGASDYCNSPNRSEQALEGKTSTY